MGGEEKAGVVPPRFAKNMGRSKAENFAGVGTERLGRPRRALPQRTTLPTN